MDRYFFTGKSEEVLASWPDNCVGSVVTDPPYGLNFMGKNWDKVLPPKECWAQVYRVLKPGGYMCVFGSPRMFHRLAVSLEDAGFFLKDCLMWLFGSGFPKSHSVSKAIDKMNGAKRKVIGIDPEREKRLVNQKNEYTTEAGWSMGNRSAEITEPATDDAKRWEGWGSALKPAWEPILLVQKPIEKGLTIAKNVLKWGVGAINIDDCRIKYENTANPATNPLYRVENDYKTKVGSDSGSSSFSIKKDGGRVIAHAEGRFPANLIIDCTCENPTISYEKGYVIKRWDDRSKPFGDVARHPYSGTEMPGGAILVHTDPNCPCYRLDRQSGISKSTGGSGEASKGGLGKNVYGTYKLEEHAANSGGLGDTGGASRFFYQPKANKKEKNYGCDDIYWDVSDKKKHKLVTKEIYDKLEDDKRKKGNIHPTVKPINLLGYLIRLITPVDEVCLDPFSGSGSTLCAAAKEKRKAIGIDMEPDSVVLAQARLNYWEKNA